MKPLASRFALALTLSLLTLPATLLAQDVVDSASADASADAAVDAAPAPSGAVERGRYLVENVAMCGQCHSPRNAKGELDRASWLHGAPVPVSMPGGWADPWAFKAPRIAGLPQHTDEEFVRLMKTGVNRDGRELMLPMPPFRMDEADALAIAAYLRTLN